MSLDRGKKAPEMKLTPVTPKTERALDSVFKQLFGNSELPDGSRTFEGASFGVCNEGFYVSDIPIARADSPGCAKIRVNSPATLMVSTHGCSATRTGDTLSMLIPWRLFAEAFITLPLQDLMALVGHKIALDIVFERPVVVGEDQRSAGVEPSAEGVSSGEYRVSFIVDATCREVEVAADPARDEEALVAGQVGRQVDAALERSDGKGDYALLAEFSREGDPSADPG